MKIETFDNIVDFNIQHHLYRFCRDSMFKIGWEDVEDLDKRSYPCLHSDWSLQDLTNAKIKPYLEKVVSLSKYSTDYNLDKISKVVVNLTKPNDVNFAHVHNTENVILYYVNLEWKDGWSGETTFYDENAREIIHTSQYTPGRFVLFNGNIPHSIKAQSIIGPQYRFTLSIFCKDENRT